MNNVEILPIENLIPYARNARTHSDAQVAQIAGSIREFGFCNPVLIDENDGIIAGHGRVMAARKLGLTEAPCIRLSHLTKTQRRAYILADNRIALNADWDMDLLALEFDDLKAEGFDLDLTGFDADELVGIAVPEFLPGTEDDQGKLDELSPIWVKCPHCGKEFNSREQG